MDSWDKPIESYGAKLTGHSFCLYFIKEIIIKLNTNDIVEFIGPAHLDLRKEIILNKQGKIRYIEAGIIYRIQVVFPGISENFWFFPYELKFIKKTSKY